MLTPSRLAEWVLICLEGYDHLHARRSLRLSKRRKTASIFLWLDVAAGCTLHVSLWGQDALEHLHMNVVLRSAPLSLGSLPGNVIGPGSGSRERATSDELLGPADLAGVCIVLRTFRHKVVFSRTGPHGLAHVLGRSRILNTNRLVRRLV